MLSPSDPHAPHAKPETFRYGLYGALSHPLESTGPRSCDDADDQGCTIIAKPLSAPPRTGSTGTVLSGPA
ncbi:conserved membrane domain protein [Mycobacterium kansasii 662]|uniref:Conserved membrane domain protein n=1 Tax=Mycobacterium kansasii 662 TaxID=1299326 RepID=X7XPE3_MYCKA|nr:conserved membrane domain protein [Mycobacterium kansasii 662]